MSTSRLELTALVVVGAALVALGLAFGRASGDDDPRASTFVDSSHGLHALHLVLERSGARPRRLQGPLDEGASTVTTMVLAAPSRAVTQRESKKILDWVARGGRLVAVTGREPAGGPNAAILRAGGVQSSWDGVHAGDLTRFDEPSLGQGIAIDWPAARSLSTTTAGDARAGAPRTLVSAEGRDLVVEVPFGDDDGSIVFVADPLFLDNEHLARADNAVLAVRLLLARDSDGGEVAFDEFHHGFRASGAPADIFEALLATLPSTWPGRALLVIGVAALLRLLGAAIRFGAPDPDPPPPRRALAEHAEALGRLLEKARASREVLQILVAGTRRLVGPRAGLPASLPAAEFARRLAASPAPGAAELAVAVERAGSIVRGERRGAVRDSELAAAAAELATRRRRFLHGGG